MEAPPSSSLPREASLGLILKLKGRVFARRHGHALNAVLAVGALALAAYGGERHARARVKVVGAEGFATELGLLGLLVGVAALILMAVHHRRRLTSALDNHFFLCLPIRSANLAWLQILESMAQSLAVGTLSFAFYWGATRPLGLGWGAGVLAALAASLFLGGAAPFLATLLEVAGLRPGASSGEKGKLGWLGYPLALIGIVLAIRWAGHVSDPWRGLVDAWRSAPAFLHWPIELWDPRQPASQVFTALGLILTGLLAAALAFEGMRRHRAEIVSRAMAEDTRPKLRALPFFRRLLRPLSAPLRAFLTRDLLLLTGRGYERLRLALILMLAVYPVYSQISAGVSNELAAELTASSHAIFVALFAAYFLAVDFWKYKSQGFEVERSLPIPGALAFRAALGLTVAPAVLLALLMAPLAGPESLAWDVRWILGLKGALLGLCLGHFLTAFALDNYAGPQIQGESALAMAGAILGIGLALGLRIHWATIVLYPLVAWKMVQRARQRYERMPVDWLHSA